MHLNKTQIHLIINWVKWVLTQLNSININFYWVLIGYSIRPNYDSSIIFTNHLILKYPKPQKLPKYPQNPTKDQNTPKIQKMTKISLNVKITKIPQKPKK